jgi:membrane-associated phospholipid phosphatase
VVNGQNLDTLTNTKKSHYQSLLFYCIDCYGGILLILNSIQIYRNFKIIEMISSTSIDNGTALIPILQLYTGKYLGFKPKNISPSNRPYRSKYAYAAIVLATKHIVKAERPDQSDYLSFPSGHTAIAFTNAALLYQEYKSQIFWYASSGFFW